MAVTTYDELKTAVSAWVERASDSTYVAQVDTFIDLAESIASRALIGHYRLDATSTLTTDANGEATLPTDLQAIRSVIWDGSYDRPLNIVSWAKLQELNPSNIGGIPNYAAVRGTTIKTAPIAAGSLIVNYWQRVPALNDSNTTNWLLTDAPDAYLFLSVAQGHIFNEYPDKAAQLEAMGRRILSEVKSTGDIALYASSEITLAFETP